MIDFRYNSFRKTLILIFFFAIALNGYSQKTKTYYIDRNGDRTSKGFAKYKREKTRMENKWFVKDYYLNGILQMEGWFNDKKLKIKTDTFNYYYLNGKLLGTYVYKNNKKQGECRSYYITGNLSKISNYDQGNLTGYWAKYNKEGLLECEIQEADISKIRELYRNPYYIGGRKALFDYLRKIEYPYENSSSLAYAKTIASFQIDKTGKVDDVDIIVHGSTEMDSVIINHIEQMPNWIPKIENGKTVPARFILPINFILGNNKAEINDKTIAKGFFVSGINDYKEGRYKEAVSKFTSAVELDEMNAKYQYYLGHAYYKIDKKDFACEYWKIANMLNSDIVKKEIKDLCNIK